MIIHTNETINRRAFPEPLMFYVCPHPQQFLLAELDFLPSSFPPLFSLLKLKPAESRKQIPSVLLSLILLEWICVCVWCVCVDNLFSLNSVRFGKQALTEAAVSQQGSCSQAAVGSRAVWRSFPFPHVESPGTERLWDLQYPSQPAMYLLKVQH